MKRFLTLAVLAVITFSGCIKENDTYKELQPILPGIQIHDWARTQNDIAMRPASMAFRLGLLLAEAAKQNPDKDLKDIDLSNVTVNKVSLQSKLFNGTKIEFVDEGYKLTFTENVPFTDGYFYKGSLLIRTNGAELLSATTLSAKWVVVLQNFQAQAYNSSTGATSTIHYENCYTEVYNNDGSYAASANGVRTYVNDQKQRSNWTADFTVTPANESLAFSDCAGKDFVVTGKGEGPSFASFDYVGSSTELYYKVEGKYRQQTLIDGTETAKLNGYGDYDLATYPAREVIYRWTFNESTNKVSYAIYYNSFTYPKQ